MAAKETNQRATFRIVIDEDIDSAIAVTAVADFPDALGRYRESVWAQMTGEDYYRSQLVLRSRDGNFVTYDFYSEQAWIDMLVETQVQERLAPIEQAEREAALNREVERRVQERMTVEATLRQMRGTEVASIYRVVDTVAGLPVYVGQTKKRVEVRIQDHVRQALAFSGEPRFHAFLRQRIEEQRLPTIQVVRQVFVQDARAAETAEIRRLIAEGASLFNRESVQATTRARMQMGEIQLLIEKTGGL
jgi:hypothetical protein